MTPDEANMLQRDSQQRAKCQCQERRDKGEKEEEWHQCLWCHDIGIEPGTVMIEGKAALAAISAVSGAIQG